MSDNLKYSLEQMQQTLSDANRYTELYSEAITTMDTTIKNLSNSWVSTEVGTYDAFLEKYNARRQETLKKQIENFNDTANDIKRLFS